MKLVKTYLKNTFEHEVGPEYVFSALKITSITFQAPIQCFLKKPIVSVAHDISLELGRSPPKNGIFNSKM